MVSKFTLIKMKKYFNNQGFTIMELLVAMSIFSILTTFVVFKYADNEKLRSLKLESSKILFALQKAENMAITGQIFASFVPTSYELSLSNCSDNCFYDLKIKDANDNEQILEKQELKKLQIKLPDSYGQVLFKFLPPRGRLEIIDEANKITVPSIKIDIGNDDIFYCLEVNSISGRIDLKNGKCQ